jgi:hypothetical protein
MVSEPSKGLYAEKDDGLLEKAAATISGGRDRPRRVFYNQTRAGLLNSDYAPQDKATYGGIGNSRDDKTFLQGMDAVHISEAVRGPEDYDYEGAEKAGVKPDPKTGHMPDTYKLPTHITFSDDSIYADKGAGKWRQVGKVWHFTPGPTNLQHHSMDELRDYFKKYEPDAILEEPK